MRMTRKIRRAWLRGKPEWAKCYLLKQRQRKQTQIIVFDKPQSRLHNYSRYLVAGVMLACLGIGQGVANASEIVASPDVTNNVVQNNNVYDIYNQQVNNGSALNRFDKFNLSVDDIANLQLGGGTVNDVTYHAADRQINLVSERVVIDGVLNSFKDGKIGGDIYFFSDKGIAIGANGVVNVGSLTLGTSVAAGQSIFDDYTSYNSKTSLEKAKYIADSGDVSINGTINSIGDVIIGSNKINAGEDSKINTGAIFTNDGVPDIYWTTANDYRSNFMNLNGVSNATSSTKTASGDIVLFGSFANKYEEPEDKNNNGVIDEDESIQVIATIDFKGDVYTSGGDFLAVSINNDNIPRPKYSYVNVTNLDGANIVTNGGDITVSAVRNSIGEAKVEITNANLDATDKFTNGTANGNVNVTASTITETFSWAMDGSDATVNITNSELTGDNISVSALASTVGKLDADSVNNTNEEINAAIESSDHRVLQVIKDLAVDAGLEVRSFATGTKVHANSEVNILDSNLTAVGGSKGEADTKHGDINVNAVAASEVTTMGLGALCLSATAGISDVNAQINIGSKENSNEGSILNAANDVILNANGSNKVDLYYLDIAFLDGKFYVGAATNWAEVNSNIKINVDGNSKIKATDDVSITAESIRTLINYACSGGDADYLGVTTSISLADTNAEAIVNGDIYADGDVNVSAKNSVAQDKDGYYTPDTSIAESMSGDTFMGKSVAVGLKKGVSGLVGCITDGKHHVIDIEAVPSKGKEFGINAATAVLSSHNTAKAEVNGNVTGKSTNGAAKSLTVDAENISRSNVVAMAYQNELTKVSDGSIANNKDYGVASSVNVGVQNNSATASVNGVVNVTSDLLVNAETKVPWQSATWETDDATGFGITTAFITNLFTSRNAGMSDLVDSWAQSNNSTEKAAMAASIGVMEYKNESNAFIGENAMLTVGGKLDVSALNEIVTANFAGNISSPITMMPLGAVWKYTWGYNKEIIKPDMWGTNSEYASLGGSAVAVHQANKASAYIADGARVVSTGNVDVKANNQAANVVITAAGGKSDGVTLDATVGVTRTENSAYAYIGNATVNSGNDVKVAATDNAIITNIGGAIDESGGTLGIGATVTYNHIDRDTQAYILGNVNAGNSVVINAKNTGEIVAASVAGSESVNSTAGNAAGSSGLHAADNVNVNRAIVNEESLTSTVDEFLNLNVAGENNKKNVNVDVGQNAANNAANNGQGANASAAKNGFAVAANVAVNRITDSTKAFIDKKENTTQSSSVTAKFVKVTSENDSEIASASLSASLDFSSGKASTGIAGSFMYNGITSYNDAYIKNTTLTLSGNTEGNKDEALTISAQNAERIFNLAGSGSIAPKGNAIVGQISVNDINNTNNVYLQDSIVRAAEKVSVKADDNSKIESYTGAMSLTGGSFAVGAAIGIQDINNETTAVISNTEITGLTSSSENSSYNKGGSVEVIAQEQSEVTSIVAAGSIGLNTSMAAEAAVSVNDVNTITKAYIDSEENIKASAIKIAARNLANATVGVGQIGVGKNAFGAASATMLSKNYVEAYLKGDATKTKLIEADSVSVEATNTYNGSAENSGEDDTTAKIVAVGGVVGTNTVAGAGSASVNIIDNDTKAHIDEGIYGVNGAIDVNAQSKAYMFGLAGGVSVAKAAGFGAAVDTQMLDVDTQAYIADNVTISKAGNITVNANSIEKITSVAAIASAGGYFAGAAGANAHDVDVNTEAYIGTDTATSKTVLGSDTSKVGNISVTASDNATLSTNAGSLAIEAGSGGAAIGGSAAVELLDKNVKASVGKVDVFANNLSVTANNTGNVITTANGIAVAVTAYGGAGAGSASESIVNYMTDAHIADGSTVDVVNDVILDANSNFEHTGVATALAGSSWVGIGLSNDTTVLNMNTLSYVGDGNISAGDDVSITADNIVDITSAVASGSGGIAAIDGGVGVNVIDNETKAYIASGSEVSADNNTSDDLNGFVLHAQDNTNLDGGSGGATLGVANAGSSVNVNDISKNTQACIGSNAVLNSKGATKIEAINKEDIFNVTVQGTGGLAAGLAGAVAVHNLDVITKVYTDAGVKINLSSGYENAQAVNLTANHSVKLEDTVVSGAIGIGAVAGSVSVINLGTGNNTETVELLNGNDEQSFDVWLNEQINQSNTSQYLAEYDGNTVASSVKATVDVRKFNTSLHNSSDSSEAGTISQLGVGTIVNAESVNVNANDNVEVNVSVGTGSAGGVAVGASVGVVNNNNIVNAIVDDNANITTSSATNIHAEAISDIYGFAVTPAVGIIAGSAAALDLNSAVDVNTFIGNGASISAQSISVQALTTPKLNAYATGVGVGIAGVGTVEALVSSKDNASVYVSDSVTLNATGTSEDEGEVEILAATQKVEGYNAYVKAEAGSGGVIAGSVTVSQIELDNDTNVTIGQKGKISGKKISILAKHEDAFNYENLSAGAAGVSGLGSDNMVIVTSDVNVSIGESNDNISVADTLKANITSTEETTIIAENISIKSWLNATDDDSVGEKDYNSLSAGASLAGGAGIVNETNITHNTDVILGDVVVKANATPLASEEIIAGLKLSDKNAITINAHSNVISKDYQYIGAGSAIEAAHIDDTNNVTANTTVNIDSTAELYAGDVEVADTSTKITDSNLTNGRYEGKDIGSGSIAVAAYNDADIYSKTIVNVWGAAGYAGTSNNVTFSSNASTSVDGTLETANGHITLTAGKDSANNESIVNVNAHSQILNNTLIPISHNPDPLATVNSNADIIVGSNGQLLSDGNVYLRVNASNEEVQGYGEIKDWAHAMADDIGAKNSITGDEIITLSANVKVDGYVETGIHRDQSIVIGGNVKEVTKTENDTTYTGKVWDTTVERTSGVGFEFQDNAEIISAYKNRLEELRNLISLYSSDDGAVVAYEAELQLIMDKMVDNGLAHFEVHTENDKTTTVFVMYDKESLITNQITIEDMQVNLGNIIVEADNLYGSGILNAGVDSEVKITNNSPNNLVVNDVIISGDSSGTINSLYNGGHILFNNVNVSNVGEIFAHNADNVTADFENVVSKTSANAKLPELAITSTFNPSDYIADDEVTRFFSAPNLTVADGAKIYNDKGSVVIESTYGDVNNNGTITAGSVFVKAVNGDYTQNASDRIVDVGGSPVGLESPSDEVNKIGSGILANGNVYISARYININSTIQSGVEGWSVQIPEEPKFYMDDNKGVTYSISEINAMSDKGNHTFTLANGTNYVFYESACDKVTYDVINNRILVDGIETNGGHIELVGTILNTVHSSSDGGNITVLDGSSKIEIINKSDIDLELRNVSTGENVEGVIKITDLDFNTGAKTRTTTYTRKDGVITTEVQTYENGVPKNTTSTSTESSSVKYNPAELYYVWQEAYDSTIVKEYHYSDSKPVAWWEDGDFSDADIDIETLSTTTTKNKLVEPNGTYITDTYLPRPGAGVEVSGGNTDNGYYEYKYTITTYSERYDERTETNRLWYTLGILKEYDHWYKEKTGTTTVTHHAIDASSPVAIKFIGSETGGDLEVTNKNSNVFINGYIKNSNGYTDMEVTNIYQGANGFIDTGSLGLVASENIGSKDAALMTNAAELDGVTATKGSVYLYDTNDKLNLTRVTAKNVASITATGDIFYEEYIPIDLIANVKANRVELTSENGSITDIVLNVGNAEKTSDYGLKVSAASDINIMNNSGDLYIDSVISEKGNVTLSTDGNFIDNNFTDVIEDDVQEKLAAYRNAQVLEKESTTANFQKDALINASQAKYNRYQALKKQVVNGKYTLADNDKAALQKLGFTAEQIAAYITERQAEYESLKAFGADAWDKDALENYKTSLGIITTDSNSVYANASLQASDVNADTFLTAEERASVLVGSARSSGDLLVGVSNAVSEEATDTTLTRKAIPNISGKEVNLIIREKEGNVGSASTITTTVDDINALFQKNFTDGSITWTKEEKQLVNALMSAENGDIAIDDNGNVTIKVVDALVVNAENLEVTGRSFEYNGETYGNGKVGSVYVESEKTIAFDSITANGDVSLKSDDSINGRNINTSGNVVLEAANGTIGNGVKTSSEESISPLTLGVDVKSLTARAKEEINISLQGGTNFITPASPKWFYLYKAILAKRNLGEILYVDDHAGKDVEEDEREESKVKDTSITLGVVSENETFQKI